MFGANRWFSALRSVAARAGLIYLGSVVGMLALIRVGTIVLEEQDRAGLRPALIVLAVGLHFLPFAKAFHTPMFTTLGSLVALLGLAGLILGWAWKETSAPAVAVLAGIIMLAVITLDAVRANPERAGELHRT